MYICVNVNYKKTIYTKQVLYEVPALNFVTVEIAK